MTNEKMRIAIDREIKMTMGCTDPGAIAYAASKAASILDGELKNISVILSKNIYKNAVYVDIPVIKKYGIELAALLGAIIKKPEMKLTVLGNIDSEIMKYVEDYIKEIPVMVTCSDIDTPLYISVTCSCNISSATVIIKGDYDWIYHIEKDNQTLYHCEPKDSYSDNIFKDLKFQNLIELATDENLEAEFLLPYEKINKEAVTLGLSNDNKQNVEKMLYNDENKISDISSLARIYVFTASKMRMSGEKIPIASLAGSGNLGIISFLTVSAVCDARRENTKKRARALYISILIAIYIKSQMHRLTVMCGTAVAGAAGAAAATAYLMHGSYKEVEVAVNTVLGSIAGILCDGAKESCAFKVGIAAECAVMSGYMSINQSGIKSGRGIITNDIDKNIRNIGHINDEGMREVDNIIIKILNTQKDNINNV